MEVCGEYLKQGFDQDLFAYFRAHYRSFFPKLTDRTVFVRQAGIGISNALFRQAEEYRCTAGCQDVKAGDNGKAAKVVADGPRSEPVPPAAPSQALGKAIGQIAKAFGKKTVMQPVPVALVFTNIEKSTLLWERARCARGSRGTMRSCGLRWRRFVATK